MYLRADWPGKLRRAPDELDFLTSITFLAEARFQKDHRKIHSFSLSFWKKGTDFTDFLDSILQLLINYFTRSFVSSRGKKKGTACTFFLFILQPN